jgi:hypothetical protein
MQLSKTSMKKKEDELGLASWCQQAHGDGSDMSITCGTFPTTTTNKDNLCLVTITNATVIVNTCLSGAATPTDMAKGTVLCDLIPTTDNTGKYSSVPSKAIFNAFHGVHVNFLRQLFVLGICIFHAISDKNMKALLESLGKNSVRLSFVINGSHLTIFETAHGLIMTTSPAQHNSHALWGAVKLASRIYDVHGFTTVRMIAAMITETFLPVCMIL